MALGLENIGRLHHGYIVHMWWLTRAQYYYAVHMIEKQKQKHSIRSEQMGQQIINNENTNLRKEAHTMKGTSNKMPHSVNNITQKCLLENLSICLIR